MVEASSGPVKDQIPLLNFDPETSALLEPAESAILWASVCAEESISSGPTVEKRRSSGTRSPSAPAAAVACFFPEVVAELTSRRHAVMELPSGDLLWEIQYNGQRLAVFYPGIGAPLATYSLELAIAAGCRSIVACGGAGAIRADMPMGHHIVTVTSAIRDEGTSYHYLPPSLEVSSDPKVTVVLAETVTSRKLPHLCGRTWTTDGIFRETASRIAQRRRQGCLTVEMEASAMIAAASFRGVNYGHLLYVGDDLSGGAWAAREWKHAIKVRELLFDLAATAALALNSDLET
jgi:uridine phosphorylase